MRVVIVVLVLLYVFSIVSCFDHEPNYSRSRAQYIRQETSSESPTTTTATTSSAPSTTAPATATTSTAAPTTKSPTSTTTSGPNTPTTTARPSPTSAPGSPSTSASPTVTTTRAPTPNNTTAIDIDASSALSTAKIWGPIVGGIVGGFILVAIFAVVIYFRVRRIKLNKQLLASDNFSGSESAPGVSLPTQHFDTLLPSQDQEMMAEYVQKLDNAFKRNRFNEVTSIATDMYSIAGYRGLTLPNPSNIFIALIKIMESDQFLHSDPRRQLAVVRVAHRMSALSLLEKAHRGTRLSEDSKQKITNNITTLKRIAAVERGSVDRPDEFEMNFHLDCISQCLYLMEDTSLTADKLVRAVSNVTNPSVLLNMVSQEIEITPRAWYRPILVASLLAHLAREDKQALLALLTRPALHDKISADQRWRTMYHHAMLLGEILASTSSSEAVCMMALTGETEDVKITEQPLVDMAALLKFEQKHGAATAVRAKAFSETFKTISATSYHNVRSTCMMLLLERRVHETSPDVRRLIDSCMDQAVTSGGLLDQWKQEITTGTEHVIMELDNEWRQLQENKAILTQRKNEHREISRFLSMKNVELNELQSRLNRKRLSGLFQKQLTAIEQAANELKQIKKQAAFEECDSRTREIVLKRMELEELLESLPSDKVNQVRRMEEVVQKLEKERHRLSEELQGCAAEMEKMETKVKEQQEKFDIKRHNFETIQKDFHLAALLSVQELENKTRKVESSDHMDSHSSTETLMDRKVPSSSDEVVINVHEEDVPNAFVCPITCHVMKDPVFVVDTGHTYERTAIEKWFEKNSTDPLTGVKVANKVLAPNHSLRNLIANYKRK